MQPNFNDLQALPHFPSLDVSCDVASHAGVFCGARISSLPKGRDEIRALLKTPAWEARCDAEFKNVTKTLRIQEILYLSTK